MPRVRDGLPVRRALRPPDRADARLHRAQLPPPAPGAYSAPHDWSGVSLSAAHAHLARTTAPRGTRGTASGDSRADAAGAARLDRSVAAAWRPARRSPG